MKGLLLTYTLAYGGSAAALFYPFAGICIYYLFVFLRPQELWAFSLPPDARFSQYVALATLIGWGLQGLSGREGVKHVWAVLLNFGALVLMVRLSAWWALDPAIAELVASTLLKIFIMFIAAYCLIDTIARLRAFIWVILVAQGYLSHDLNVTYFLTGINSVVDLDGFGALNNNTFALSLLPGVGLAFMMAIHEKRLWLRIVAIYVAVTSIHVILLSESRGAYLGVLTMSVLAFAFVPKNVATVFTFLLIVAVGYSLVGESVRAEFATIFADELDESAESRYELWGAAYRVMIDHPLLGVGPNNFSVVSGNYGLAPGKAAHNLFLQTGADSGMIALAFLMTLYFLVLNRCRTISRWASGRARSIDPLVAGASRAALVGISGYLVHSVFSAGMIIETPYVAMLIGVTAFRLCHEKVECGSSGTSAAKIAVDAGTRNVVHADR